MQQADENNILKELTNQERQLYIRKYCPVFTPEFGTYTIKTRPPHYTNYWKLNLLRRSREEELRDEAMQASRLKCHEPANAFTKCSYDNPLKEHVECKSEFSLMKQCFVQEMEIEMDKRRRDIERNNEWWWTNIYNENGEIGEQALTPKDTYVEKIVGACYWIREKSLKLIGRD